jgi:hypothetical protein
VTEVSNSPVMLFLQAKKYILENSCIDMSAHMNRAAMASIITEASIGKASMNATTIARRFSKRLMVRKGLRALSARRACTTMRMTGRRAKMYVRDQKECAKSKCQMCATDDINVP